MDINNIKQFIQTRTVQDFPQLGKPYYFESERISINYAKLVPGHFYTFSTITQMIEDDIPSLDQYQTKESRKKPYFDRKPIILSLGQEGPVEVGLNIKIMPHKVRVWFIQKYLTLILPTLETLVDENGDFIELHKRMILSQNSKFYHSNINRSFVRFVGEQIGLNLEFLVDKYTRGEMGNPLSIIDWPEVPLLGYTSYDKDGTVMSKTPISYFLTKFT